MKTIISIMLLIFILKSANCQAPDQFTDPRDGKVYTTIEIGNQVWMSQNLNYDAGDSCSCFENKPKNCEKYGRLYPWKIAKNVCPAGWHLPASMEFEFLEKEVAHKKSFNYEQLKDTYMGGKRIYEFFNR